MKTRDGSYWTMGNRILYLARGGLISGSQRQLLNLLTRIDRKQYVPLVVCSEGGDFADRLTEMGIEVHVYPAFFGWRKVRYFVHRYRLCTALLRKLSGRNIRLIHCSYQWYAPYCLSLSKQLECPCAVHVRCPVNRSTVRKYSYVHADHLIAISPRSQKNLIDAGICPENISLIYDSIDTDIFRPLPKDSHSFDGNGDFVFGFVGRIEPAKYQLEFIRAASIVALRHANVKFILVGQERNEDYAREVKQLISDSNLSDRIVLYGRSEQMPSILSRFDVLVSLSGGSIMYEAMACGVPVLSAGYTKVADSVHVKHDYNAMLVDSREPERVAHAMGKMLINRSYTSNLAENTRKHILDHLDDRIMATRTQTLYDQLLGQCSQNI